MLKAMHKVSIETSGPTQFWTRLARSGLLESGYAAEEIDAFQEACLADRITDAISMATFSEAQVCGAPSSNKLNSMPLKFAICHCLCFASAQEYCRALARLMHHRKQNPLQSPRRIRLGRSSRQRRRSGSQLRGPLVFTVCGFRRKLKPEGHWWDRQTLLRHFQGSAGRDIWCVLRRTFRSDGRHREGGSALSMIGMTSYGISSVM